LMPFFLLVSRRSLSLSLPRFSLLPWSALSATYRGMYGVPSRYDVLCPVVAAYSDDCAASMAPPAVTARRPAARRPRFRVPDVSWISPIYFLDVRGLSPSISCSWSEFSGDRYFLVLLCSWSDFVLDLKQVQSEETFLLMLSKFLDSRIFSMWFARSTSVHWILFFPFILLYARLIFQCSWYIPKIGGTCFYC
jgi:hypothetical protein